MMNLHFLKPIAMVVTKWVGLCAILLVSIGFSPASVRASIYTQINTFDFTSDTLVQRGFTPTFTADTGTTLTATGTTGGIASQIASGPRGGDFPGLGGTGVGNALSGDVFIINTNLNPALDQRFSIEFQEPGIFSSLTIHVPDVNPTGPKLRIRADNLIQGGSEEVFFDGDGANPGSNPTYTKTFNFDFDNPAIYGRRFELFTTDESAFQVLEATYLTEAVVPEPGSIAIWSLIGLVGIGAAAWRRRHPK